MIPELDFDPMVFMTLTIFIIFMLVGFITLISYNILDNNENRDYRFKIIGCNPESNMDPISGQCIPKPTPLPENRRFMM